MPIIEVDHAALFFGVYGTYEIDLSKVRPAAETVTRRHSTTQSKTVRSIACAAIILAIAGCSVVSMVNLTPWCEGSYSTRLHCRQTLVVRHPETRFRTRANSRTRTDIVCGQSWYARSHSARRWLEPSKQCVWCPRFGTSTDGERRPVRALGESSLASRFTSLFGLLRSVPARVFLVRLDRDYSC